MGGARWGIDLPDRPGWGSIAAMGSQFCTGCTDSSTVLIRVGRALIRMAAFTPFPRTPPAARSRLEAGQDCTEPAALWPPPRRQRSKEVDMGVGGEIRGITGCAGGVHKSVQAVRKADSSPRRQSPTAKYLGSGSGGGGIPEVLLGQLLGQAERRQAPAAAQEGISRQQQRRHRRGETPGHWRQHRLG